MREKIRRLVLADDNTDMLSVLAPRLQALFGPEAQVHCAGDGEEAYRLLLQEPAQLLVTDFAMPRLDGGGLIERLAGEGRLQGLAVLVITGGVDAVQRGRLTQAGAGCILEKPFSDAELHRALLQALGPEAGAGLRLPADDDI